MNDTTRLGWFSLLGALLLGVAGPLWAQEAATPGTEESAGAPEAETLVLEELEVIGEGFSFEQEFTLRLLRDALYKPKSLSQKDRDEWVCWIDEATGSHFNYLNCARNGDIWANGRPDGLNAPTVPIGGYGKILRSERPVNRYKLEQAMATLEGPEGFDQEFLSMVVAGDRPPRDIPTDEELDQFAQAYTIIGRLQSRGASEARQIRAIEAQGLTLKRYNHIAGLTEVYQTIENSVAERLDR